MSYKEAMARFAPVDKNIQQQQQKLQMFTHIHM